MAFYKTHPLTCDSKDFWGQVKRTVNGKPVDDEQIRMIVDAVTAGLDLQPQDLFLDFCCGNGALSTFFFQVCRGGLGVDYSEPLIHVARENFEQAPQTVFLLANALGYAQQEPDPDRFTKALCYGSFQYLPAAEAAELLLVLRRRFQGLQRLFIGNVPDKDCMAVFCGACPPPPGTESDPDSPIGIWRSQAEFADLARGCGWDAAFSRMPEGYYAAAYRYDVLLTPAEARHA